MGKVQLGIIHSGTFQVGKDSVVEFLNGEFLNGNGLVGDFPNEEFPHGKGSFGDGSVGEFQNRKRLWNLNCEILFEKFKW